jgi:hypothetical protein
MARGKPWTDEELGLLKEMAAQDLSPQQIYDAGKFQRRTFQAIKKQIRIMNLGSIVATNPATIVTTIKPTKEAMSMDELVKHFTTATFPPQNRTQAMDIYAQTYLDHIVDRGGLL